MTRFPFHLEDGGHCDIIAAVARGPGTPPFLTPCTGEIALRVEGIGSTNMEDGILVTEQGYDRVTRSSPELHVVT